MGAALAQSMSSGSVSRFASIQTEKAAVGIVDYILERNLMKSWNVNRHKTAIFIFYGDIFLKVDFFKTIEAKVIILPWYVKPNVTMAMNKFVKNEVDLELLSCEDVT